MVRRIEHEVTIDRPAADVFAYVTDFARVPEWQATAIEGRLESERMEEGAEAFEVRKLLGREMKSKLTIVEYDPPRRFATEVESGPLNYRVSLALEPENGSTKVQFVLEGEPGGFFSFDEPVVEEQVRNQIKDDFRSLKIRLETGAA